MCKFFSFVGDGHGHYKYAAWEEREALLGTEEADSHTAILTRAGVPPDKQAAWSKYEYNPLMKEFTLDCGVDGHDHAAARNWVSALDWSAIVPALIIKPVVHPFVDKNRATVTKAEVALLRKWASVWDSVRASVGTSVWDSVGTSVWDSVWDSVGTSVWDSVGTSVWASVGASVRDSVRASVGASVWAYISSFFAIDYKYDYSPAIKLWGAGLVASFDGKTWRLHGGKKAKVLYERTPKNA